MHVLATDPQGYLRPSDLALSREGLARIAVINEQRKDVRLFVEQASGRTEQFVWPIPPLALDDEGTWLPIVLRLGSAEQPVILLGRKSLRNGWIKMIEPDR